MAFEYFDIPYRYNETRINLLFQNPYTLFAFWDISDDDEKKYIEKYGEESYYNSRIYLKIINVTNGKTFNVDVNPFAKNWYIKISEPNCKYKAEICRLITNNEYSFASSNILTTPNNRALFPQYEFEFVNPNTGETVFNISLKEFKKQFTINNDMEVSQLANDRYTNGYLLTNPSSLENVSSGTRYMKKEESNG